MNKTKILIASVLKPVNEPRMYEKLALSLSEIPNSEVHLAGFKGRHGSIEDKIILHEIFNFKRLSLRRIFSGFIFLGFAIKLRPQILIINTFELIPYAIVTKLFAKITLVYDIRENHRKNIKYLGIYPWPIKSLILTFIGIYEFMAKLFFDKFIYAEKCYSTEFSFESKKTIILENKYSGRNLNPLNKNDDKFIFAFTGTVHTTTGIFNAIRFLKELRKSGLDAELKVCGHCSSQSVYQKIMKEKYSWLDCNISLNPMPKENINTCLDQCHIVLAPYIISQQNLNKFPSKVYEALANGIPIILSKNEVWERDFPKLPNICYYDFEKNQISSCIDFLNSISKSYPRLQNAFWGKEKEELIKFINF